MTGFRIDLHVHTRYSDDAMIDIENLPKIARKRGLKGFSITDHNTMKAYERMPKVEDILTVRGVEIYTNGGHIACLFVSEVPSSTDLDEALDEIRGQGGLAVMVHPFGFPRLGYILRSTNVGPLVPLARKFDAIEVCNSRVLFQVQSSSAKELALRSEKPVTGGSDAHFNHEVGKCYTIFEDASSEDELYNQLKSGKTKADGSLSSPIGHAFSVLAKGHKLLFGI